MTVRVASLLASATEIVHALGLRDHLVAISHECDYPPDVLHLPRLSKPRFDPAGLSSGEVDAAVRRAMSEHGSVYQVDENALAALQPDVIFTQAVCEVCAVPTPGVRELVARRGIDTQIVSLDAHSVEEILGSIMDVGAALGASAAAGAVAASLRARVDRVKAAVAGRTRPRVLAIEWLDPPFAPGHWVPEMIEIAGGHNIVGRAGAHSTQLDWAELEGHDPDVLLIMPCGYGVEASVADAEKHRPQLQRVAPRAIAQGRAYVVDGSSYFNRSGPRVVDGIELTASLLHGLENPRPEAAITWK